MLQVALEAGRVERVNQPGLGSTREERESQAEQDRGDRPAPQRRMELPHHQVEEGGDEQRGGAQHIRESPAAGVGHHAGRHLEDDLANGEEGVRGERLRVVEPCVEQEEGIDAPDERGSQCGEQREDEVGAFDAAGGIAGHHMNESIP